MESQNQIHEESRNPQTNQQPERGELNNPPPSDGIPPGTVQSMAANPIIDFSPPDPTPREIEEGINASVAFYEDATSQKFSQEPMDEETKRVLYQLHKDRQGWTEALENDARCALQSLYPDNGGSRVYGPL